MLYHLHLPHPHPPPSLRHTLKKMLGVQFFKILVSLSGGQNRSLVSATSESSAHEHNSLTSLTALILTNQPIKRDGMLMLHILLVH